MQRSQRYGSAVVDVEPKSPMGKQTRRDKSGVGVDCAGIPATVRCLEPGTPICNFAEIEECDQVLFPAEKNQAVLVNAV